MFTEGEYGTDTLFVWSFKKDLFLERSIKIKYYAADQILGLIGGIIQIFLLVLSAFVNPWQMINFVALNASKKEEIKMCVG